MRTLLLTSLIAICLTATVFNIFRGGSEVYKLEHAFDNDSSPNDNNFLQTKNDKISEIEEILEMDENDGDILEKLAHIYNNETKFDEIASKAEEIVNTIEEVIANDLTEELIAKIIEEANGEAIAEEILGEGDDEGQCEGEGCNEELGLEEILQEIEDDDEVCEGEGCNEEMQLTIKELLKNIEDEDEVCEGEGCNEEAAYEDEGQCEGEGCNEEAAFEELLGEDDEGQCEGEDCNEEAELSNSEGTVVTLPEDEDGDDDDKITLERERDFLAQLNDDEIDTA